MAKVRKKELSQLEETVLSFIKENCRGQENSQTAEEIGSILGLENRVFRHIVHCLRLASYPILSKSVSGGGYWWPSTLNEGKAALGELYRRLGELRKAGKGIEKGLSEEFSGQSHLDLPA